MLKLNLSKENLREIALSLTGAEEADDSMLEEAGDVWTEAALGALSRAGVHWDRDYGQRVGAFVITQAGPDEDRAAWDAALEATMHLAEAHLAKAIEAAKAV